MPKTRDAFALRDFDEKKILFRFYSFNDIEDVELLNEYFQQYSGKMKPPESLSKINARIDIYADRIMKHQKQLTEYLLLLMKAKKSTESETFEKVTRVGKLMALYDKVLFSLAKLKEQVFSTIEKIEATNEIFYRERFSSRLKAARKAVGLTQIQLANKLGMTQSGYSPYENSLRDPSLATLSKLSRILNRPTDWLIGLTP